MLYLELLKETLSVVVISILATLVLYILMCWILSKFNKYNVKNFAFIFCSFLFIPFMLYELSLFFAGNKVERTLVEPARKYAQTIAYGVDTYTSVVSETVNKAVDSFVSKKVEEVKDKMGDEIENIIVDANDTLTKIVDNTQLFLSDSLRINADVVGMSINCAIDSLSSNTINAAVSKIGDIVDCTAGVIKESTAGAVSETMNLIPANLVSKLKEKFPALSIFLTEQGINGDTCEEIINSVFNKMTDAINSFKISRILTLLKYTIFFVLLSLFCGWRKTKRKQRQMARDIS